MCSNADPRAALAEYIRHKTDNGNKVVDYLHDVLEDRLDGVKHGHRTRASAILSEYGDLASIRFQEKNKEEKKSKPSVKPRKREEREDSEFDAALARVIRDKTNDTEDVADYLIDTMNGIDSAIESGLGEIRHQQRVSAAQELLRRAFDNDPAYAASTKTPSPSRVRVYDNSVVPTKAGTQKDPGPSAPEVRPEPTTNNSELNTNDSDTDEPVDYLAIVKRVVESLGPVEEEEEDDSGHKPDYSMWDMIEYPPLSEISDEHAEIGAALFHEAVERDRLWKKANAKTPTRKDHDNYDDG